MVLSGCAGEIDDGLPPTFGSFGGNGPDDDTGEGSLREQHEAGTVLARVLLFDDLVVLYAGSR